MRFFASSLLPALLLFSLMMIRAYQNIKRRFSLNKHQKLLEDSCHEPVTDGVTFYVRYLGCCGVPRPSGEEVTAEAIKNIIQAARKDNRRLIRVSMLISVRGIKMSDLETGKTLLNFSIYRISYCSADATFTHVFAFLAVNRAECLQCHAFLARKQKIAQTATLTIAQAFNLAFDKWKQAQSRREENSEDGEKSFKESGENSDAAEIEIKTAHSDLLSEMDDEVLLIDLRSPDKNMQIHFQHLTENSCNSQATSCPPPAAPGWSECPPPASPRPLMAAPSPLHGSCLTPRQLMTPAPSPMVTPRLRSRAATSHATNRLQHGMMVGVSPLAAAESAKL